MAQGTKQAKQNNTAATGKGGEAEVWVQGAEQGLAFARKHSRTLMGGALALVLVVIVGAWAWSHKRAESREASAAFAKALSLLDRPSDEDRKSRAKAREERDKTLAEAEAAENEERAAETKRSGKSDGADGKRKDAAAGEDDGAEDALEGGAEAKMSSAQRRAAMAEAERDAEKAEDEEAEQMGIPRFATSKERDVAGQAALLAVAERYPKLAVGTLAALEAAALAAKNGDLAAADATYARLWAELSIGDTFKPVVAQRYAESKKRAGDIEAALEALGRISQSETRFLADEAAMERVYLLEGQGEVEKARTELAEMAVKFPDSALQGEVRAELAALEAEASQPAAAAAAGKTPAAAATPEMPAGAGTPAAAAAPTPQP